MQNLDLQWRYRPLIATGLAFTRGNVWCRAARRKKQQSTGDQLTLSDTSLNDEQEEPALGVKVRLAVKKQGVAALLVRWLQGRDSVLFESFCGMLKRQLCTPAS